MCPKRNLGTHRIYYCWGGNVWTKLTKLTLAFISSQTTFAVIKTWHPTKILEKGQFNISDCFLLPIIVRKKQCLEVLTFLIFFYLKKEKKKILLFNFLSCREAVITILTLGTMIVVTLVGTIMTNIIMICIFPHHPHHHHHHRLHRHHHHCHHRHHITIIIIIIITFIILITIITLVNHHH